MSNNQCASCGRWAGSSHRCPATTPNSPTMAPERPTAPPTSAPAPTGVNDRVARAQAALNQQTPTGDHDRPTPELWDAIRERSDAIRAEEDDLRQEKTRALNAYQRASTPEARENARTRAETAQARLDDLTATANNGIWIVTKTHNLTPEWKVKAWQNTAAQLPEPHRSRALAIAARITAEQQAPTDGDAEGSQRDIRLNGVRPKKPVTRTGYRRARVPGG